MLLLQEEEEELGGRKERAIPPDGREDDRDVLEGEAVENLRGDGEPNGSPVAQPQDEQKLRQEVGRRGN